MGVYLERRPHRVLFGYTSGRPAAPKGLCSQELCSPGLAEPPPLPSPLPAPPRSSPPRADPSRQGPDPSRLLLESPQRLDLFFSFGILSSVPQDVNLPPILHSGPGACATPGWEGPGLPASSRWVSGCLQGLSPQPIYGAARAAS